MSSRPLSTINHKLSTEQGFTLVETMVAIFVMLIAIVAPMSIASKALSSSRYAKEQVTAYYLAQEGIELVRNIRDNNVLAGKVWNQGNLGDQSYLGNSSDPISICYSASGCQIDAKTLSVSVCDSGCSALEIDSSGIYTYTHSEANIVSQFVRTVRISKISDNEIQVTSNVSWPGAPSGFTITDNLMRWQ